MTPGLQVRGCRPAVPHDVLRALRWQRLPPFRKIAQLLLRHLDGILAYYHEKIPFGKVEAINGNSRAVLRRGRGYRDPRVPSAQSPEGHGRAAPVYPSRMNTELRTDSGEDPKYLRRAGSRITETA